MPDNFLDRGDIELPSFLPANLPQDVQTLVKDLGNFRGGITYAKASDGALFFMGQDEEDMVMLLASYPNGTLSKFPNLPNPKTLIKIPDGLCINGENYEYDSIPTLCYLPSTGLRMFDFLQGQEKSVRSHYSSSANQLYYDTTHKIVWFAAEFENRDSRSVFLATIDATTLTETNQTYLIQTRTVDRPDFEAMDWCLILSGLIVSAVTTWVLGTIQKVPSWPVPAAFGIYALLWAIESLVGAIVGLGLACWMSAVLVKPQCLQKQQALWNRIFPNNEMLVWAIYSSYGSIMLFSCFVASNESRDVMLVVSLSWFSMFSWSFVLQHKLLELLGILFGILSVVFCIIALVAFESVFIGIMCLGLSIGFWGLARYLRIYRVHIRLYGWRYYRLFVHNINRVRRRFGGVDSSFDHQDDRK